MSSLLGVQKGFYCWINAGAEEALYSDDQIFPGSPIMS